MQRRFDLEVREARRIIREHKDNPDDFRFTRTPKKGPGEHLHVKEYTVNVSRGKAPPVGYEGGQGKNWVVLYVALCRNMNLFTEAMVAVDSSKFKAVTQTSAARGRLRVGSSDRVPVSVGPPEPFFVWQCMSMHALPADFLPIYRRCALNGTQMRGLSPPYMRTLCCR